MPHSNRNKKKGTNKPTNTNKGKPKADLVTELAEALNSSNALSSESKKNNTSANPSVDFSKGPLLDGKEFSLQKLMEQQGIVSALEKMSTDGGADSDKAIEDKNNKSVVKKLKKLQEQYDQEYEKYMKDVAELEKKFREKSRPMFQKRKELLEDDSVPDFWFEALMNAPEVMSRMSEEDEEALKYVCDIDLVEIDEQLSSSKTPEKEHVHGAGCAHGHHPHHDDGRRKGYKLLFSFRENPFFENKLLSKEYLMHPEDPDTLLELKGTEIQWKPGKNLTVRIMKKTVKKGKNKPKQIMKTEKKESFFNIFSPPKVPSGDTSDGEGEGDDEEDEIIEDDVMSDYELGEFFRNIFLPRAVDFYTGEILMDDEDDEDEEDDEDDEEDDDDDDDNEEDEEDEDLNLDDIVDGKKRAVVNGKEDKFNETLPQDCKQQ